MGDQQDPEDHSEVPGVRRHPCKECANCRRPDCRRCIFCRDKRKYGGRNIKKQKCEYKDSCSQSRKCTSAAPSYEELTPYEKIRADNIREREEMLEALGIKEALDEYKSDVGLAPSKSRGSSRKTKERDRTE